MIKLAVNARLLQVNKLEGIGVFMHEILSRLVTQHPEIEFHFFFNKPSSDVFKYADNVFMHHLYCPVSKMGMLQFWQNELLRYAVNRLNPNALLCMDSLGQVNGIKAKVHYTLHDINFVHRPQDLPNKVQRFYAKNVPMYLKKANRIATVSQYSKNDISNTYGVDSSKIDVIYNAPKQIFQPLEENEIQAIRLKYAGGNPYFVYVGSIHPRKNLEGLIRAFQKYKFEHNGLCKLVVVGEHIWDDFKLASTSSNDLKEEIIFTGRISDKDLSKVVASALALTFIPFFEGFGIPLVEAMASKVPVLTSNTTSIPEIIKEAGSMHDPKDYVRIAEAMKRLEIDSDYRKKLIELGVIRAKAFDWQKSSEDYWRSLQNIL